MHLFLLSLALAADPAPVVVDSITAHLVYHADGTLSDNVAKPDAGLWNTIIGEGSARLASTQTLVKVTLRGAPGEWIRTKFDVRIRAEDKMLLQQTVKASGRTTDGRWTAFFVVSDTGCDPLTIEATVPAQGKAPASTRKVEVPFACGE